VAEVWQFVLRRPDLLGKRTLQHLYTILVSNGISLIVAVAAGVWTPGSERAPSPAGSCRSIGRRGCRKTWTVRSGRASPDRAVQGGGTP